MNALTLRRVALIAIPVGVVLAIVGIIGFIDASGLSSLLWFGTVLLLVGIASAVGAAWGKRR